ncbi:DUF5689 domain-containing protein [Rasiella sp. SM2506]|uniref:DUF5689 domain-containing protein n=1 Tax=Rasiella sp. SM2506 TaxID=3423914 RepID=UPI003D797885
MKTFQFYNILLLVAFMGSISSCVEDDEYEVPETASFDPALQGELVSITSVIATLESAQATGAKTATFEGTNTFLSGFVISTDESGNFFEELILQDEAKNPTAGIKVLLDVNPLFTKYEIGRKIFIKLDGLSVGLNSGVVTLGVLNTNEIDKISAPVEDEFMLRSAQKDTLIPTVKTLSQITSRDVNTLIQLPNAQFTESQLTLTFANEPGDEFDGDRLVESCSEDGGSILFQTSTFADFRGIAIPDGSGTITAVLSRNFFGDENVLVIRDPNDIVFASPERCEPKPLDPMLEPTTTFAAVRARYEQAGNSYAAFGLDEDLLLLEGYVISSDEAGNFFDEIFIQNTPETEDLGPNNPRMGLRVIMDKNDIYQTFEIGRKVYIILNGLAVDEDTGILTLGIQNVNNIVKIPNAVLSQYVVGGEKIVPLTPLTKQANQLNADDLNTLINLNHMQFLPSQIGLTYAGEPADNFDGERTLQSCNDTGNIRLFTSTFANFKSQLLADGSGNITAIYTRNFSNDESVLSVRDLNDINFSEARCDPPIVDCGLADAVGATVLFADFFETQTINSPITGNGWTNYMEAGTETWEAWFDGNENMSLGISARMGSFNSGDPSSIGWLITPQVNFDTQTGETLHFKTSNSFDDGSELKVLYAGNWDGNENTITSAMWIELGSVTVVSDNDGFPEWIPSGNVDMSCIVGRGHIAWKYIGSGNGDFDGTYELDEIEIRSN